MVGGNGRGPGGGRPGVVAGSATEVEVAVGAPLVGVAAVEARWSAGWPDPEHAGREDRERRATAIVRLLRSPR